MNNVINKRQRRINHPRVFSPPEGARLSNRHFFEFYQISIPNRPEFRHLCQSDTKSSEAVACTDSRFELTSSGLVASEKINPKVQ